MHGTSDREQRTASRHEWLAWQLVDTAFPTGGFAHSWGLEAAWQAGEVPDTLALRRFVDDVGRQTGRGSLPLLTAAYRSPSRLEELDALADAFLTNVVANRASRVQGRAFASSCRRIWPSAAVASIDERARNALGHCAPVVGATLRALEVPIELAQRLFLYSAARGVLAAAVRLGITGTYQAQRLLYDQAPALDAVLERCGSLDDRDLAQVSPIPDLLQASHDRLYSRLFQS